MTGDVLRGYQSKLGNEFGLIYVSMYILGNYARYFPEKWMFDVETASPLALGAIELMSAAAERVPVLALGEFTRKMYLSHI